MRGTEAAAQDAVHPPGHFAPQGTTLRIGSTGERFGDATLVLGDQETEV
jgi:hypothetical protein